MTFAMLLAAVVLAGVLFFIGYYYSALRPRPGTLDWVARQEKSPLTFAVPRHRMEKRDVLPVLALTAVYALTAFFSLGDTHAPQTYLDFARGQSYTVKVSGTPVRVYGIRSYSMLGTGGYNLEVSADGEHWSTLWTRVEKDQWDRDTTVYYWADAEGYAPSFAISQAYTHLFKWEDITPENPQEVQYFRITGRPDGGQKVLQLGKLALLDENGEPIIYNFRLADGSPLPEGLVAVLGVDGDVLRTPSWRNSTYFDEIYHARTALEHIENVNPYEITHPPLGKLILGLGIRLFGMTPFGWRCMGTLFGVLMVPLLYVFLKNLFGKTPVAVCGAALFTFDFMHLTQTRIATIDTYGVFFILASYFFFYRWLTASATPGKKGRAGSGYLPLALSGVCFGLGVASKWTVLYAGAGLAALYAVHLVLRLRRWDRETEGRQGVWVAKTLALSVLCFVLVPLTIYTLSYLPYATAAGVDLSLQNTLSGFGRSFPVMWDNLVGWLTAPDKKEFEAAFVPRDSLSGIMFSNQWYMLHYHAGVETPHPYSSRWYQWIVDARPILYYSQNLPGGLTERFMSFNNPILSWAGLFSLIAVGVRTVQRRCGKGLFLLVGFAAQLVPWLAIGRITFAYHYFPSTLFLALAVSYVYNDLMDAPRAEWRGPVYGLTAGAVGLYALFYPCLIGLAVPTWYSQGVLQFLPSWPM